MNALCLIVNDEDEVHANVYVPRCYLIMSSPQHYIQSISFLQILHPGPYGPLHAVHDLYAYILQVPQDSKSILRENSSE